VLLSTHIMQEIKAICTRVIIINKGEIVADYSDLSKIRAFDETSFHFEVEFSNEISQKELEKINDVSAVNRLNEKHFTIISTSDTRSAVFDFAVKTNNKILMIKPIERSMEDVFRSLTK